MAATQSCLALGSMEAAPVSEVLGQPRPETLLAPNAALTAAISLEPAPGNVQHTAPAVREAEQNPAPRSPALSTITAQAAAGQSPDSNATTLNFAYEDGSQLLSQDDGVESQAF